MKIQKPVLTSLILLFATFIFAILVRTRSALGLLSYNYYFPDSFDWIVNGLRYSNQIHENFDITHRALLLPYVVAFLYNYGLENYLVLYGALFFALSSVSIYFFLSKIKDYRLAFFVSLFFLCSFTIQGQSAFLGSDVAANFFLIVSALTWLRWLQTNNSILLYPLFISLAFGLQCQYIGIIFSPVFAISFFLKSGNNKIKFTLERFTVLKEINFYLSLALGLLIFALFLLPRYLTFGVIYEQKVQHTSLMLLNFERPLYYIGGLFSSFSLPAGLLAILGFAALFKKECRTLASIYMFLWFAWIYLFFAHIYHWFDIRLLIYLSLPFFYFATLGLSSLLSAFAFKNKAVSVLCKLATIGLVLFFVQSPATNDPWDQTIAISPWHYLNLATNQKLINKSKIKPYLSEHYKEIKQTLETIKNTNVDGYPYSKNLLEVFSRIREVKQDEKFKNVKIIYYEPLNPSQIYYISNRNIIYARTKVLFYESAWKVINELQANNIILVTRNSSYQEILSLYDLKNFTPLNIISNDNYTANYIDSNKLKSALNAEASNSLNIIDNAEAQEHPERLFNRIVNDPNDFGASPLGIPIVVSLKNTLAVEKIILNLWSFDNRSYKFKVEIQDTNSSWKELSEYSNIEFSGRIVVNIDQTIKGFRITGLDNSDLNVNPGNSNFHLTEIEIKTRTL